MVMFMVIGIKTLHGLDWSPCAILVGNRYYRWNVAQFTGDYELVSAKETQRQSVPLTARDVHRGMEGTPDYNRTIALPSAINEVAIYIRGVLEDYAFIVFMFPEFGDAWVWSVRGYLHVLRE